MVPVQQVVVPVVVVPVQPAQPATEPFSSAASDVLAKRLAAAGRLAAGYPVLLLCMADWLC